MKAKLKIVLCMVAAIFVLQNAAFAVDLKYAGSTTVQMGFMYDAATAYKELHGKTISIMGGSSSAGVRGLLMETIDIGGASRALKPKETKRGVVAHVIAWDAIAVVVNKKNAITNLSLQQLKDIFTGVTRNWKDVGGPDQPIVVVTSHVGSATKEVIHKIVMQKEPWVTDAITVNSTRDELGKVIENEYSIGAVSVSFVDPDQTKIVHVDGVAPSAKNILRKTYKIARPLNLMTLGTPRGEAKKFIDFMLSPTGQEIVARKFIPVR